MLFTENTRLTGLFNEIDDPKLATQRYLDMLGSDAFVKNTIEAPDRRRLGVKRDKEFYQREIMRWRFGDEVSGLGGMYYGYYMYADMLPGKAEYRRCDWELFELVESCLYGRSALFGDLRSLELGTPGIYVLGRRRIGKSQKLGWVNISVAMLNRACNVGVSSKTEDSGREFLREKTMNMFYRLPIELRAMVGKSTTQDRVLVAYDIRDAYNNLVVDGLQSSIEVRAPSRATVWEGATLKCLILDEFPKMNLGGNLLDFGLPALNDKLDGYVRTGLPIVCGVAGDFDKDGLHGKDLWTSGYREKNFLRYFTPAWEGRHVDSFGNEDVERGVLDVMRNRARIIKTAKDNKGLLFALQQYPLTPDEALLSNDSEVLPRRVIALQSGLLYKHTPTIYRGRFKWTVMGKAVEFVPDSLGEVELLELRQAGVAAPKDLYVGGVDSYDIRVRNEGSSGALVIVKRGGSLPLLEQERVLAELAALKELHDLGELEVMHYVNKCFALHLRLGDLPVCRMVASPKNPDDFSEQCVMAAIYFGCRLLVERKPSTTIGYIESKGFKSILLFTPIRTARREITAADYSNYGILYDEAWAGIRLDMLYRFFSNFCGRVYLPSILNNADSYDPSIRDRKYDDLDALGTALIGASDLRLAKLGNADEGSYRGNDDATYDEAEDPLGDIKRQLYEL